MRYLDERVWVIIRELRPLIERSNTDIVKWQTKKKLFMRPEEADLDPMPWESFDSSTDRWYGKDTYYWFRAQFTVPQSMDQKCIFLKIHTQIEEWDDGRNPQFLLFVDGQAVQGQDMNHREVRLTDCAEAGRTYTLDLQAYTGILHNEFSLKVTAAETDLALMKLYYDLKAPRQFNLSIRQLFCKCILNDLFTIFSIAKKYCAFIYNASKHHKYHIHLLLFCCLFKIGWHACA